MSIFTFFGLTQSRSHQNKAFAFSSRSIASQSQYDEDDDDDEEEERILEWNVCVCVFVLYWHGLLYRLKNSVNKAIVNPRKWKHLKYLARRAKRFFVYFTGGRAGERARSQCAIL